MLLGVITFDASTFIKKQYLSSFIRMSFLISTISYENYYIIEEHINDQSFLSER